MTTLLFIQNPGKLITSLVSLNTFKTLSNNPFSQKLLLLLFLSGIGAGAINAQNITISAANISCDHYGNNYIHSSPSTIDGNSSQQKVTITFQQYQCEPCKQITFTKNDGSTVNLLQDANSGTFAVTGTMKNPSPAGNLEATDNTLSINGLDCGWDIGNISITMYLKYEKTTNTLYYSSNPINSEENPGDNDNGNNNNNTTNNGTATYDDLILGRGDKQFIFHIPTQNPNDPPVLYIAPKKSASNEALRSDGDSSNDFDWNNQITFKHDGGIGIGVIDPQVKNAKLQLYTNTNSTDTVFGLHATMDNITTTNTSKPSYGAYFRNTQSSSSGSSGSALYGAYLDNTNNTYSGPAYGVYSNNTINGYGKSEYGFYTNKSGGSGYARTLYGFYSTNSVRQAEYTSTYGTYLKNTKGGGCINGTMYGIHVTNIDSSALGSVYGAYLDNTKQSANVGDVYGIYSINSSNSVPGKTYGAYFSATRT